MANEETVGQSLQRLVAHYFGEVTEDNYDEGGLPVKIGLHMDMNQVMINALNSVEDGYPGRSRRLAELYYERAQIEETGEVGYPFEERKAA